MTRKYKNINKKSKSKSKKVKSKRKGTKSKTKTKKNGGMGMLGKATSMMGQAKGMLDKVKDTGMMGKDTEMFKKAKGMLDSAKDIGIGTKGPLGQAKGFLEKGKKLKDMLPKDMLLGVDKGAKQLLEGPGKFANMAGELGSGMKDIGKSSTDALSKVAKMPKLPDGLQPFLYKPPFSPVVFAYETLKDVAYALTFSTMSILNLPFSPLDQFIPEELCKKLNKDNKVICESTFGEYALSGIETTTAKLIPKVSKCSQTTGKHISVCKPNEKKGGGWDKTKNYKTVLERLIKLNLYLRRYEAPSMLMNEILKNITDKKLLRKMIEIYKYFTIREDIKEVTTNETSTLEICDKDLLDKASGGIIKDKPDYKIKSCDVEPDMVYLDYDRSEDECPSCGKWFQFLKVVSQYKRVSITSLFGEQNDMFIIVNIIYDVILPKIKRMNHLPDNDKIIELKKDIGIMFSNINCRCKLLKLMEDKLDNLVKLDLKPKKLTNSS